MSSDSTVNEIEVAVAATGDATLLSFFQAERSNIVDAIGIVAREATSDILSGTATANWLGTSPSNISAVIATQSRVSLMVSAVIYDMRFSWGPGFMPPEGGHYQFRVFNLGLQGGLSTSIMIGRFHEYPEKLCGDKVSVVAIGFAIEYGAVLEIFQHKDYGCVGWLVGGSLGAEVKAGAGGSGNSWGKFKRYEKKWYSFLPGF